MKNLIFLGTFDPINEFDLLAIKRFITANPFSTVDILCSDDSTYTNSKVSLQNRLEMIKIGIESLNIEPNNIDYGVNNQATLLNLLGEKIRDKNDIYILLSDLDVNNMTFLKQNLSLLNGKINILNIDISFSDNICEIENVDDDFEKFKISNNNNAKINSFGTIFVNKAVYDYIVHNKLYFVEKLFKMVDLERFKHSVSVSNICYDIALGNHLNRYKAYISGLLHDCGKDIPYDDAIRIIKAYFPEAESLPRSIYHQFVGTYLCNKDFGIRDKDILRSIAIHTTGNCDMNGYEKTVYSADKIDPLRGYDSKQMIESCISDINKGFLMVLKDNLNHFKKNNISYKNIYSSKCMEFYLGEK